MLPFDWRDSGNNRDEMMQRLAPNWPEESPDFGVSYHLSAALDADADVFAAAPPGTAADRRARRHAARQGDQRRALLVHGRQGPTTRASAVHSAYFAEDGWTTAACVNDPDYGCRRPFLIIISDGDDVCKGEDATADVSDMKSHSPA